MSLSQLLTLIHQIGGKDMSEYEWPCWTQKGWECPRCGKILAPWMSQCDCHRNNWTITWNSDKTNPYSPSTTPVSPEIEKYKYTVTCKSDLQSTFTGKE